MRSLKFAGCTLSDRLGYRNITLLVLPEFEKSVEESKLLSDVEIEANVHSQIRGNRKRNKKMDETFEKMLGTK